MEYIITEKDENILKIANKLVKKWRKILQFNNIWTIDVELIEDEEMEGGLARININTSEYFRTTINISDGFSFIENSKMVEKLEEAICHELVHLLMIDFYRTGLICAGENSELKKELLYKYEQVTTKLQKSFLIINKKIKNRKIL